MPRTNDVHKRRAVGFLINLWKEERESVGLETKKTWCEEISKGVSSAFGIIPWLPKLPADHTGEAERVRRGEEGTSFVRTSGFALSAKNGKQC